MTVRRFDIDTYLVSSSTRADVEHIVDVVTQECSCEYKLDFDGKGLCRHLEAALAKVGRAKPRVVLPLVFCF